MNTTWIPSSVSALKRSWGLQKWALVLLCSGFAGGCMASQGQQGPDLQCPNRPPPLVISPEEIKRASESATALVRNAVQAKVWSPKDRQALRQALMNLPQCERAAVLTALARAINNDQLKVSPEAFPPL